MIDRCHNRDCRTGNFRRTASKMPPCRNELRSDADDRSKGDLRCPCNANEAADPRLIRRLQALDFSIVDTVLYLDAYPHCPSALEHYHRLVAERGDLLRQLAEAGTPITIYENESGSTWDWGNSPWPWEPSAN